MLKKASLRKNSLINQELLQGVRIPFLMRCGFLTVDPLVGIHVFIRKAFPSDNTAGVLSRTFIVKNISNSLTYTIASSCVCTSPLAVMTIVGLHDFVKLFADHVHRRSGVDNKSLKICCRQAPISGICWSLRRAEFESTPRRSETNGVAERAGRRVKESTSSVLSGLQESWRAEAVECCSYLRKCAGLNSRWPRFNSPFGGPIIPVGADVNFYPITSKDQGRVHQVGTNVFPGMFIGYALGGDVGLVIFLTVDTEGPQTIPPCETHVKDSNQKKWKFSRETTNLFSNPKKADILQEWQTLSTSIYKAGSGTTRETQQKSSEEKEAPDPSAVVYQALGDNRQYLQEEPWQEEVEVRDPSPDLEARQDFRTCMGDYTYWNHGAPRMKLHVIPLSCIDVQRHRKQAFMYFNGRSSIFLGILMETGHCLNRGSVSERHMQVQGRLVKKHVTRGPGNIGPKEWSSVSKNYPRKARNQWAEEIPNLNAAREHRGIHFIPDDALDYEDIMNNARRKREMRRASAMPCKITTPANPSGSSWARPCARKWSKMAPTTELFMFEARSWENDHRIAKNSNYKE